MEAATLVLPEPQPHKRIASPIHTVLLLAAQAGLWYSSYLHASQLNNTTNRVLIYERTMVVQWSLFAFVVLGAWMAGSPLSTVLGERWRSVGHFFQDLGIAIVFLIAALMVDGVVGAILPRADNGATQAILPHGSRELMLWIALSLTAGICEETLYRGYLQRQFIALTQNAPAGILISAAIFGAAHAYQGFHAFQIALLGLMGGALAYWRKSVRPNMIAHTLQDVLGGIITHG